MLPASVAAASVTADVPADDADADDDVPTAASTFTKQRFQNKAKQVIINDDSTTHAHARDFDDEQNEEDHGMLMCAVRM